MANSESSSNTAIVALSVLGMATAAGVFIYYQGGFGGPAVVQHETTVIEKQVPAPAPADEPGYKLEHEDASGNKTVIEAP